MERLKISMEKLEKLMRFFAYKIGVILFLVSSVTSLVLFILIMKKMLSQPPLFLYGFAISL